MAVAAGARPRTFVRAAGATALVAGDLDVIRPLTLAGIRCAVVTRPDSPARFSRHVCERMLNVNPWRDPDGFIDLVLAYAHAESSPPVLFVQEDGGMLAASRGRDRLAGSVRFLFCDEELVERLGDKARFSELAGELGLPVPAARAFEPWRVGPDEVDVPLPAIVKPLQQRHDCWRLVEPAAKAARVASRRELDALWPRMAEAGLAVLVQEEVPGPESLIESYHPYLDADGDVAADFTGRKLRTWPRAFGYTTALEITDTADVRRLGREIVERLELRGVAKLDFKRAPDGSLRLLEVNPRFTLWHHAAALAGVNIPALYHADLTGSPRPPVGRARAGVRWCMPLSDLLALRAGGARTRTWVGELRRADARSAVAVDDPLPAAAALVHAVRRRLPSAKRAAPH